MCSRHFKTEDFRWTLVRKCLKPDAVPSVFSWTTEASSRKPPTQRLPPSRKVLAELPLTSSCNKDSSHTEAVTENQAQDINLEVTVASEVKV